ncbi:MAG: extracellular solute-binding protein [Limnochordia bacterium]|nr:extracellular solute-binding protein [Limnochordia bacterium]
MAKDVYSTKRYLAIVLIVSSMLGAPVVAGKTTVEIWTPYNTGVACDAFVALVNEFNETHPDIYVEHLGIAGFKADKYVVGVISGVLPNIGWTAPSWILDLYDTKLMVPVDELAERDGLDVSSYWPWAWRKRLRGHQWGMPFVIGSDALIYNSDMFASSALAPPAWDWTWDDFLSIAKKLTIPDQTYGFQRPGANYQVVQWLWRNGANLVTEDGTKATFSDSKAIEALQWYADLGLVHNVVGGNFNGGTAGMFVAHSGWYNGNSQYWSFNGATTTTPIPEGGVRACTSYYKEMVLFRSTPEEEEASWTFLKWLMEPERIAEWYVATGNLPVSRDILLTDTYQAHLQDNPWLDPFIYELDYVRDQIDDNILSLFSEVIQEVFPGKTTAQSAMEGMQLTAQGKLDERKE